MADTVSVQLCIYAVLPGTDASVRPELDRISPNSRTLHRQCDSVENAPSSQSQVGLVREGWGRGRVGVLEGARTLLWRFNGNKEARTLIVVLFLSSSPRRLAPPSQSACGSTVKNSFSCRGHQPPLTFQRTPNPLLFSTFRPLVFLRSFHSRAGAR